MSELTTNIVNAATGGDGSPVYQAGGRLTEMCLRLMSDRARLRIEVWDNLPPSAGVPVLRRPARDQEHGRGLALVGRLSQCWGWDPVPGQGRLGATQRPLTPFPCDVQATGEDC